MAAGTGADERGERDIGSLRHRLVRLARNGGVAAPRRNTAATKIVRRAFGLRSSAAGCACAVARPDRAATVAPMKMFFLLCAMLAAAAGVRAADATDVEQQVREAVKSPRITVVHLWAPWCANCKAELVNDGWSSFLAVNPDVDFIFVTVWRGEQADGRATLASYGVGPQKNFRLFVHPNASRKPGEQMTEFLGLPVTWIPATWVFRDGKLRYALNYGELRFPLLQQLLRDSMDKWDR
jgi:hypothetical protein